MLYYGETRYECSIGCYEGADCALQIEYLVVAFDEERQKVRLSLCQADVLKALARDEELAKKGPVVPDLQNGYVGFYYTECCSRY